MPHGPDGRFVPGQSGNPAMRPGVKPFGPEQTIHGFYKGRRRTCDACGTEYIAHKLTSRFCSNDCRTNHGAWSYPASSQTNKRVFGTTKN